MTAQNFEIDGALLAGAAGDWRWNNLGDWQVATDYEYACIALARRHAEFSGLSANSHLLEFACGYGASFELWRDQFQVKTITALEYRQRCVDWLNQSLTSSHHTAQCHVQVLQGRFDRPLPNALTQQSFDVLLCIDAAYHATSLHQFLITASTALRPKGVLCFSTLMWADSAATSASMSAIIGQQLLKLASIPAASVLTQPQIKTLFQQLHWTDLQIQPIEQHVFEGFANWVQQQNRCLAPRHRYSMAWQKICATARLCRWLQQHKILRYVMIRATYQPEPR